MKILTLLCAIALLWPPAVDKARAQSSDDYSARIARDITLKMAATAAYNELRATICPDANARSNADPAVARALNCDTFASPGQTSRRPVFADRLSVVEAAQGVWTTKGRDSCSRSYYTWTVASKIGMS